MPMRIRIQAKTPNNPGNSKKTTHSTKTNRGQRRMIITVHSYKGGTGKTLIAANLAMIYASRGKNVCLLDLDLRAPSLSSTFKNKKQYWINDYLNRACKIDRVLNDCTPNYLKEGKLFVGVANPSTVAIREITAKDRSWEMEALGRLFNLKASLIDEMLFDYVILDSSPGLQYSSINAIVAADLVLVVTSIDKSDVQGTQRMIHDLYELFEKKTGIIKNKVPETLISERNPMKLETNQLPVVGLVPCSCDVLRCGGKYLFASKRPDHAITKTFQKIVTKIEQIKSTSAQKTNLVIP
jgi:MinD-like ATPase involved in chromosome partitioning or flagellar assembly